jgi:hypothetical protein
MGRIKDLVIELQNEYGFDLENMPNGFAMDEYLEMKSKEEKPLSIIVGNPPFPNKLVLPKVHLVVGNPPFSNSDEFFCQTINIK